MALCLGTTATQLWAGEACTYDEAMLALAQGNWLRASVLLRMAAADGDARAQTYLAETDRSAPAVSVAILQSESASSAATISEAGND